MAQATVYSSTGQQQQPASPPVKKPRVYPYRDGQSQAAQHYDLFEMIRHPHLARDQRPPDPPPAPKYASKQQQIEAELEKKLKRANTGIVAAFVKGIVFVGFFPFYLLFIALPRWIYQTIAALLKQLKKAILRKVEAVKQFFIRCYRHVVDPFKTLWKRMSDREKNKQSVDLGDEDLGFFAFIALGVYYAYTGIVRPAIRSIRALIKGCISAYRWLKLRPQVIREAFERKWAPVRRFNARLAAYPGQLLKRLKGKLIDFTFKPLQAKLKALQGRIQAAFNHFSQAMEAIATGIKDAFLAPAKTFQRVKKTAGAAFRTKIEQLKSAVRNACKRPRAFFKNLHAKFASIRINLKVKLPKIRFKFPLIGRLKAWHKRLEDKLEGFAQNLSALRATYLNYSLPKWDLSPRHLDNLMKAALYKLYLKLGTWLSKKAEPIRLRLHSAFQAVLRPYRRLQENLAIRLDKFNQRFQRFMRPIRRFIHRRILRARLFIGWIRVVARHSLAALRAGRY